ncbi:MAG: hypothetical protein AB1635_21060 [Acidobacteriota bacterium]
MPQSEGRAELARRIDAVEASYEFMLAFAAQGVVITNGQANDGQIREYLKRLDTALADLAGAWRSVVEAERLQPADAYASFLDVLSRDAAAAQAAVRLVLGQPAIGSQLVDNLNASLHVRAVLTDLFVLDEILNPHTVQTT